ncbi:hypothetical protein PAXRUDRAFT_483963 [Paxillus rubicundulus Ve08.2h10]|uniref:RING-type domain-containing protein n=1 Tax=Paxillus rubicundulus Ve08.2h10 TaxID=930991 RepID=A0A0D0E186_9AGAM|nr:hypothetical protein PAXRUDRAFT_483963 [Paxillus rubicundulus Ve08.2h10]
MLVIASNSTCDVCWECYTAGSEAKVPHAITCGHVFCKKCLEDLMQHTMQHKCPLCRTQFSPWDINKLHLEHDTSARTIESASEPVAEAPRLDAESQHVFDEIVRIVNEGSMGNEIHGVVDECREYYNSSSRLGNQYTPVWLRKVTIACDEIRDSLTSEVEAVDFKYQALERTRSDEKLAALAVERSLRNNYKHMNDVWKCQLDFVNRELDSVKRECQSLREELDRIHSTQRVMSRVYLVDSENEVCI